MARNPRRAALRRALLTRRAGWGLVAASSLLGILLGWQQFIRAAGLASQALAQAAVLVLDAGWLLLLLAAAGLAIALGLSGPSGSAGVRWLQPRLTTRSVRWGAAATGLLAVLVLVVVVLPPLLAGNDRSIQNDVRTTLLQGLGALLVLTGASIGAAVTLRQIRVSQGQLQATREQLQHTVEATRLQLKLTEQGQITDRYTRAIDQLGSQHLDIRLGGIYALERIARDSPDDRTTIEEVLTGYVRGHAPWPPPAAPTSPQAITQRLVTFARRRRSVWQRRPAEDTAGQAQQGRLDEKGAEPQGPAADVQAVMTVLTRRLRPSGVQHISQSLDLSRVDLRRAKLVSADLRYTYLERANLQGANLNGANLQGASLIGADLQGASLDGANLQGVQFYTANLQDAQLYGAILQGAYLQGTNLQGANLDGAYLFGAFLIGANLQGASLDGAYLQGAYLDGANLQGAKLGIPNPAVHLQNARADEDTRWPAGWNRARAEAHGVRYLSKPLTFPPGQGRPSSAVHGSTDQME